jgi:hypothetical protein
MDAVARVVVLRDTPPIIAGLVPLMLREITYLVLAGS